MTHVCGVVLDEKHDGDKHFDICPPQKGEKVKKRGPKFEIFKIEICSTTKHVFLFSFIPGFQKCHLFVCAISRSAKHIQIKKFNH